jgi:hypothetical protein
VSVPVQRLPVLDHRRRRDVVERDADEEEQDDDLDEDHPGVEPGRLPDAPDEHDRDERDDAEGEQVEDDGHPADVRRGREDLGRRRAVVRREPVGEGDAEVAEEPLEELGPTDGDGDVADGVLDD